MNDSSKRATLRLGAAKTADAPSSGAPRQRSGARARQAALQEYRQSGGKPEVKRYHKSDDGFESGRERGLAGRTRGEFKPRDGGSGGFKGRSNRDGGSGELKERARNAPRDEGDAAATRIFVRERSRRSSAPAGEFALFAPCPSGLEAALAAELEALGFSGVRPGRAGCHLRADWQGALRANLYSRLATRILLQVAQAQVSTEDDILELARNTEWERWFGPQQSLRVDTSAIRSPMQSLQYCNLRAKDGICDRLRAREGARPDIDTVRPDARVHLFLDQHTATLYLDLSGESMFKRGWRLEKGAAPLRENLAAGMLALAGWPTGAALLDPFCGSATILIEAAWIALGVPPGIWRPFGFERLRAHDERLWRDLKDDARSRIAPALEEPLVGCDTNPAALQAARSNIERAHLSPEAIRLELCDARQMPPPAASGWIVTNPPYGERLEPAQEQLWPEYASWLKQHYGGWQMHIISSDLDLPAQLRLKAKRRQPLHNGALDCRLFEFELVSNSYR